MLYVEKVLAKIIEKSAEAHSLTRVWQHLTDPNTSFAIITAFKGYDETGEPIPLKANMIKTRRMGLVFKEHGLGFFWMSGVWVDQASGKQEEEKSLFIIAPKGKGDELFRLCKFFMRKYRQDGFLFKPEDTKTVELHMNDGSKMNVGNFYPQQTGMMYSKLRNGQTFMFKQATPDVSVKVLSA